jgi:hypothetical protein
MREHAASCGENPHELRLKSTWRYEGANPTAVLMGSVMKPAEGDIRACPKPQRTTTVFLKTVDTLLKVHTSELK